MFGVTRMNRLRKEETLSRTSVLRETGSVAMVGHDERSVERESLMKITRSGAKSVRP